jgi:hypothetical protein
VKARDILKREGLKEIKKSQVLRKKLAEMSHIPSNETENPLTSGTGMVVKDLTQTIN